MISKGAFNRGRVLLVGVMIALLLIGVVGAPLSASNGECQGGICTFRGTLRVDDLGGSEGGRVEHSAPSGTAQLVNGEAVIELPEHFGLVTAEEGLTVVLTPLGEWLQLYVVQKRTKQLIVREVRGKTGQFDYLVQGVRKGYEDHRVIQEKQR